MNPLANIKEDKFEDLSSTQLIVVFNAYVEENRYEYYISNYQMSKEKVIELFENTYYSIETLENYFNFCKN